MLTDLELQLIEIQIIEQLEVQECNLLTIEVLEVVTPIEELHLTMDTKEVLLQEHTLLEHLAHLQAPDRQVVELIEAQIAVLEVAHQQQLEAQAAGHHLAVETIDHLVVLAEVVGVPVEVLVEVVQDHLLVLVEEEEEINQNF